MPKTQNQPREKKRSNRKGKKGKRATTRKPGSERRAPDVPRRKEKKVTKSFARGTIVDPSDTQFIDGLGWAQAAIVGSEVMAAHIVEVKSGVKMINGGGSKPIGQLFFVSTERGDVTVKLKNGFENSISWFMRDADLSREEVIEVYDGFLHKSIAVLFEHKLKKATGGYMDKKTVLAYLSAHMINAKRFVLLCKRISLYIKEESRTGVENMTFRDDVSPKSLDQILFKLCSPAKYPSLALGVLYDGEEGMILSTPLVSGVGCDYPTVQPHYVVFPASDEDHELSSSVITKAVGAPARNLYRAEHKFQMHPDRHYNLYHPERKVYKLNSIVGTCENISLSAVDCEFFVHTLLMLRRMYQLGPDFAGKEYKLRYRNAIYSSVQFFKNFKDPHLLLESAPACVRDAHTLCIYLQRVRYLHGGIRNLINGLYSRGEFNDGVLFKQFNLICGLASMDRNFRLMGLKFSSCAQISSLGMYYAMIEKEIRCDSPMVPEVVQEMKYGSAKTGPQYEMLSDSESDFSGLSSDDESDVEVEEAEEQQAGVFEMDDISGPAWIPDDRTDVSDLSNVSTVSVANGMTMALRALGVYDQVKRLTKDEMRQLAATLQIYSNTL